jgi:hypothetical protein
MPYRHLPTITFLNDLENGVANDEQGTGRRTGPAEKKRRLNSGSMQAFQQHLNNKLPVGNWARRCSFRATWPISGPFLCPI